MSTSLGTTSRVRRASSTTASLPNESRKSSPNWNVPQPSLLEVRMSAPAMPKKITRREALKRAHAVRDKFRERPDGDGTFTQSEYEAALAEELKGCRPLAFAGFI